MTNYEEEAYIKTADIVKLAKEGYTVVMVNPNMCRECDNTVFVESEGSYVCSVCGTQYAEEEST